MDYDSNFDPDEMEQLMQGGQASDQMQELLMQMKMANEMRNRKGSEGRDVGRAYVAANPLEHLADAMYRIKGNKDYDAANGQIPDIMRNEREANKLYFQGPQMARMRERISKQAENGMINPSQMDVQNANPMPQINMPPQQSALAAAIRRKAKSRMMGADEFMGLPRRPMTGATGSW